MYSQLTLILIDLAVLPKCKQFESFTVVRSHIMEIDDELCTETFLANLISYMPNKDDDLKIMEKYQKGPVEDCEELDIPEQFTIEVIDPIIYCYRKILKFFPLLFLDA